jgi:hypothetical protein
LGEGEGREVDEGAGGIARGGRPPPPRTHAHTMHHKQHAVAVPTCKVVLVKVSDAHSRREVEQQHVSLVCVCPSHNLPLRGLLLSPDDHTPHTHTPMRVSHRVGVGAGSTRPVHSLGHVVREGGQGGALGPTQGGVVPGVTRQSQALQTGCKQTRTLSEPGQGGTQGGTKGTQEGVCVMK